VTVPGATAVDAISVATLTAEAKAVLEGAFPKLWVKGEISGFKGGYASGHWYFTLKDETAQISCTVWRQATGRIPSPPVDGMQVMAYGQLTVWPAKGSMQFSVTAIEAEGEGLWKKQFDELKAKLEKEGLTDPARRRPLPRFPRTVAVITSSEGAALKDVVSVIQRRNVGVHVLVIPALVQGETAPDSLCEALARLDRLVAGGDWAEGAASVPTPDVLVIGRGGGSREDLWAFNHESVARAIAGCAIPTISAVGHETDVTIADYVADVRAATPSVAAETAVPILSELRAQVAQLAGMMADGLQDRVAVGQRDVDALTDGISRRAQRVTERRRVRADRIAARLAHLAPRALERRRSTVARLAGAIDALSPLAVLGRGFAVARGLDGAALGKRASFKQGAAFDLLLQDGRVRATAESVHADAPHLRTEKAP
jgi:exodeoxyribonuclease VII large subunit